MAGFWNALGRMSLDGPASSGARSTRPPSQQGDEHDTTEDNVDEYEGGCKAPGKPVEASGQ